MSSFLRHVDWLTAVCPIIDLLPAKCKRRAFETRVKDLRSTEKSAIHINIRKHSFFSPTNNNNNKQQHTHNARKPWNLIFAPRETFSPALIYSLILRSCLPSSIFFPSTWHNLYPSKNFSLTPEKNKFHMDVILERCKNLKNASVQMKTVASLPSASGSKIVHCKVP